MTALVSDYLSNRKQAVILKSTRTCSNYQDISVGVPQGTLCGPVLWLMFVDSLQFSYGDTVKYADDTTCYYPLNNTNSVIQNSTQSSVEFTISQTAQMIVNECYDWSSANHMTLNVSKTKVLNLSLKKDLTMMNTVSINNVPIECVDETKFLGITIDSHLKFSSHVTSVISRANKKIYALLLLKRQGINQDSLVQMYTSQVIPVLTYGAPGWYPLISKSLELKLESVQKLALKVIFPETEDYVSRLTLAKIRPLLEVFTNLCNVYISKIKQNTEHRLHNRLPKRQSQLGHRHSARLHDQHVLCCRTTLRENALFHKFL